MDFYITDSMQDMLDIDIRSEVATVVGGTTEFSSLMSYDLPSLELDSNSNEGDLSAWLGGGKWANNDVYADVGACVNPNSVMPVISSSLIHTKKSQINLNTNINSIQNDVLLPSPKEKKSHLTFSPNTIKVPVVQENHRKPISNFTLHNNSISQRSNVDLVKKDLSDELKKEKSLSHVITTSVSSPSNGLISSSSTTTPGNTIKLAAGIGGLTFANNMAYAKLKQNNLKSSLVNSNISILQKRERESSPQQVQQNNFNIINVSSSQHNSYQQHHNQNKGHTQKIFKTEILSNKQHIYTTASMGSPTNNNHHQNNKSTPQPTGQEFPKPAYSYSCLIAMALKNSRAGSLPVSEIYSFMCEHFPYFKTAPNGWKNSVRHNLSLNKCFEKIEKPATNGGQRKGCLWAMNPQKITKMDEEVQKWSRKDPMAIRKAMVFPEHLEALERGEMKHGSTGDSEGETEGLSDTEEQSDSEVEAEPDEHIVIRTSGTSYVDDDENEVDVDFDVEVRSNDIYSDNSFN